MGLWCMVLASGWAQTPDESAGPAESPALAAPAESTAPGAEDRARELFEAGSALYDEGNYEAALLSFREAQAVYPLPRMHFNIANCYERVGRIDDAIVSMVAYREAADPAEHATLDRKIAALRTKLATPPAEPRVVNRPPAVAAPIAVATRREPQWWLVGLGAGVAAGGGGFAGVAYSVANDDDARRDIALGGAVSLGTGALLAGVGLALRTEKQVVVGVVPKRRGTAVAVSGRF